MSEAPATVFVADDNPSILLGLDRALKARGYDVRTAATGGAVLRLLNEHPKTPDLVLLDVMMPELSGIDVLRALRRDDRWADVPVVLITATNDGALPVSALRDGAVDFLTKPFRLDELLARVDAHVTRNRELRRAREQARMRLEAIDLIRELNRVVSADEMFHLVTARTAQVLGVARCSVLVVERGQQTARVAASSEAQLADGMLLELDHYPEVREALETGKPVAIADVSASPLFDGVRDGAATPLRSAIVVPFPLTETVTGLFVEHATVDEPELGPEAAELAERVVDAIVQACGRVQIFERLMQQRQHLHDLANTDQLTGVATRRALEEYLRTELQVARERGEPLSVVLLDLDNFKEINDTFGHLAGDAVLRSLGNWLQSESSLRTHDRPARYGGDEFVVVLPGTGAAGALRFAERARNEFGQIPFVFGGRAVRASLSAGVASWPDFPAETVDELIAEADAALYQAKQQGRDRVCIAAAVG
ncbi:diguanylate cyclase [Longimicrobium sp.]|uniref:diguanylate cyclase n=1 Tax=Longimicrobium sp. TaxID=2029185 RepID=UPI002C898227|nr:diguanylate cyclase [Longimicrobium sp.]HSU15403.1 diguanylate cyclase [Longimicrobium sp.]